VDASLAPFWRRAVAFGIDFFAAGIAFLVVTVGGPILAQRVGLVELKQDILLRFTFFENWYSVVWLVPYFALVTCFGRGQTVGKRLCRIRVVSLTHEHPGLTPGH
jgi:uncharacterized RDD family membrane protein YckC